MRALDFPVQMRACFLDVDMPHPEIFAVPMKQSLEFMTVIRLYGVNAKRELLPNIVNERHHTFGYAGDICAAHGPMRHRQWQRTDIALFFQPYR